MGARGEQRETHVRNDFPDHPAGPLPQDPDPQLVLEIGPDTSGALIVRILSGVLLLMGLLASALPFPSPALPIAMVVLAGLFWFAADFMAGPSAPVLRLRPDGVEFPKDGYPSLRWEEIARIDIGTAVLIGAGGARDYLCVKLRPEAHFDGPSPYLGTLGRAALAAVGWDFDLCIAQTEFDRAPAHVAMEMRARHEAVTAAGSPRLPPGLEPLPGGPLRERVRQAMRARPAGSSGWRLVALASWSLGAWTLVRALLIAAAVIVPSTPTDPLMGVGIGIVLLGIGYFAWPWSDPEDSSP